MIIKQALCLTLIVSLASCTLYENQARECINDKAIAFAKGSLAESEKCGLSSVSATACPQDLVALGETEAHSDEQTGSLYCATNIAESDARMACVWDFPRSLVRIEPPHSDIHISIVDEHSLILESVGEGSSQFRFQSEVREGIYNYCVIETSNDSSITDESLEALFDSALSLLQHRP